MVYIISAFLIAGCVSSVWAGFAGHTPADFPHFELRGGELRWVEK